MKILKNFLVCATASLLVTAGLTFSVVAQQNPKLSDPEIASVAVVANKIDIGYAEIAKEKSKDPDILQFAKTMASDHKAVIDQAVALVKKLGVTPKDNALSQQLLKAAEKTKKTLESKSGAAFDKAYIDNEVAYHAAVIKTVEGTLIPQATNKDLKDLLQNVVPTLKAHLEHAEMVQKKFLGK